MREKGKGERVHRERAREKESDREAFESSGGKREKGRESREKNTMGWSVGVINGRERGE
jgi:hypothetical protein